MRWDRTAPCNDNLLIHPGNDENNVPSFQEILLSESTPQTDEWLLSILKICKSVNREYGSRRQVSKGKERMEEFLSMTGSIE